MRQGVLDRANKDGSIKNGLRATFCRQRLQNPCVVPTVSLSEQKVAAGLDGLGAKS